MLKRLDFEIYPGHQFLGILILSTILHFFLIQHLNFQISIPPKKEIFEVEFIRPPKIIPQKRPTKTYKSDKAKLPSKPAIKLDKNRSKLGKPALTIQSNLHIKNARNQFSLSKEKLNIPGLSQSSGKIISDLTPLPEDTNSTVINPGTRKHPLTKTEAASLRVEQLSGGNIKNEVITEKNRGTGRDQNRTKKPSETDPDVSISGKRSNLKIEGEVSQRQITFEPEPPVLNIESDVTITLKFTVLPNGEVDQVFPFLKAEPELEKLAISLLHKYRFEPLFGSNKVQKGIIHFTIHRKK